MPSKSYRWCAITLVSISATCHAELPVIPAAPVAQAVSELLLLDAQQALALERSKPTPSLSDTPHHTEHPQHASLALPASPTPAPAPTLTAIHGVGSRLRAHVIIDGQPLTFASGRTHALAGPSTAWRLARIIPPCIDLENSSHGAMRLCAHTAKSMP